MTDAEKLEIETAIKTDGQGQKVPRLRTATFAKAPHDRSTEFFMKLREELWQVAGVHQGDVALALGSINAELEWRASVANEDSTKRGARSANKIAIAAIIISIFLGVLQILIALRKC